MIKRGFIHTGWNACLKLCFTSDLDGEAAQSKLSFVWLLKEWSYYGTYHDADVCDVADLLTGKPVEFLGKMTERVTWWIWDPVGHVITFWTGACLPACHRNKRSTQGIITNTLSRSLLGDEAPLGLKGNYSKQREVRKGRHSLYPL